MSNEKYHREFIYNAPESIAYHKDIHLSDLRVYMIIRSFMDTTKSCYVSNEWIANKCHITDRAVRDCLTKLVSLGFIKRIFKKGKRHLMTTQAAIIQNENDTRVEVQFHPPGSTVPGGEEVQFHQLDQIYNTNNNILLAPSSQKKKKSPSKQSFGLKEMLADNPHQIPEDILSDWLDVRKAKKAKITKTAWNKTNKELSKAASKGFDAIDSFEHAVASGWQGFKCEYMENLSRTNAKTSTTNDIFGDDDDISWGSHLIKNELKGLAG